MHEDAEEYVSCVNALLARRTVGESDAEGQLRRLGILYAAWIGANSSARVGLPGAQEAMDQYRRLLRPLQAKLNLTDAALCRTEAGDCVQRTAQLMAQETADRDVVKF